MQKKNKDCTKGSKSSNNKGASDLSYLIIFLGIFVFLVSVAGLATLFLDTGTVIVIFAIAIVCMMYVGYLAKFFQSTNKLSIENYLKLKGSVLKVIATIARLLAVFKPNNDSS